MASVRDLAIGSSAILDDPQVPTRQVARLAELGLRAGARIEIVQRAVGGARVVAVTGARIALDGRTAARLPVRAE